MNRTVYYALAIAGLTAISSCTSSDIPGEVNNSENENVTFKIQVPTSLGTRAEGLQALGDGIPADLTTLDYTVYKIEGPAESKKATKVYSQSNTAFQANDTEAFINISLLKNATYQVVFCAYNSSNGGFITYTDGTVTIDYTKAVANNKDQDMFVGKSTEFTVSGPSTQTVSLTRPFAQLNWGSSDIMDGVFNDKREVMTATVTVSSGMLYKKLDILTGEVSEPVGTKEGEGGAFPDYSLPVVNIKDIPAAQENNQIGFPVANTTDTEKPYHLIAMNYLLVAPPQAASQAEGEEGNDEQNTASGTGSISITITNVNDSETDKDVTITVENAPLVQNHRTNIYGALLTTKGTFNLQIDKSFANSTDNSDQYNYDQDNKTPVNGSENE